MPEKINKFIAVANWKGRGTSEVARLWVGEMFEKKDLIASGIQVVVCPPFTALPVIFSEMKNVGFNFIVIGSQNISLDAEIKSTGEILPELIREYAEYVIIGHSERRKKCGETDEVVVQKLGLAKENGLTAIVCVENSDQAEILKDVFDPQKDIIAYEPPSAIGTGNPASPDEVDKVALQIKEIIPGANVLYGGSVNGENAAAFLRGKQICGFLIGDKSSDPSFFLDVINCFPEV